MRGGKRNDAVAVWKKLILQQDKPQVVARRSTAA
jgi:hypothetical protein